MVEENGTVIRSDAQQLIVAVVQSSACDSCRARQGCGQAVLSNFTSADAQAAKNHFSLSPQPNLQVGDVVRLGIPEDSLTLAAIWMYLWPLLAALSALLVSSIWVASEGVQLLAAVLAGGAALLFTKRRFQHADTRWEPRVLALSSNVKTQSSSNSAPAVKP
ncbi:SoxR reducing system RseC family protein [Saccharospirillum mangrovi]|uniref:SoxR reducing system RseC family protein n=1 Tax=Saccharospirillum mangrovi TaxID=2161747 RepID=UPI00130062F5|nr:SoxR reducing system RseC family protein [Saccharospirillum mangrovi]